MVSLLLLVSAFEIEEFPTSLFYIIIFSVSTALRIQTLFLLLLLLFPSLSPPHLLSPPSASPFPSSPSFFNAEQQTQGLVDPMQVLAMKLNPLHFIVLFAFFFLSKASVFCHSFLNSGSLPHCVNKSSYERIDNRKNVSEHTTPRN